jgi:hypothetical protein
MSDGVLGKIFFSIAKERGFFFNRKDQKKIFLCPMGYSKKMAKSKKMYGRGLSIFFSPY